MLGRVSAIEGTSAERGGRNALVDSEGSNIVAMMVNSAEWFETGFLWRLQWEPLISMSCELVFCGRAIQDLGSLLTFRLPVSTSELSAKSRRSREYLSRFRLEISDRVKLPYFHAPNSGIHWTYILVGTSHYAL